MPNVNNPYGFIPIGRTHEGGVPRMSGLKKAAGYAVAMYPGDIVHRVADGTIESNSFTPGTTNITGVNLSYAPASTLSEHLVSTSLTALYEAQDDGAGAAGIVVADLGLNANAVVGAPGAAGVLARKSAHQIGVASKAATATLDMHLLEHVADPTNDITAANARIIVQFNKHRMGIGTVGV